MDAGGASRKFGVCHSAHFNAAPAESGFSLQLNNNDKILCTHAVPRGIRTHVCVEKKKRALRHAGAETHLLYYTKRYISVKSFLVKKDEREVPWRASRSDSPCALHASRKPFFVLWVRRESNYSSWPFLSSLSRSPALSLVCI